METTGDFFLTRSGPLNNVKDIASNVRSNLNWIFVSFLLHDFQYPLLFGFWAKASIHTESRMHFRYGWSFAMNKTLRRRCSEPAETITKGVAATTACLPVFLARYWPSGNSSITV